jgi:hypothetical protein
VGDVAEAGAGLGGGDPGVQGGLGGGDQRFVAAGDGGVGVLADDEGHGGVPAPAAVAGSAVDGDEVAVAEGVAAGDAVHDGVVHADAADAGVGRGRRARLVAQEQRLGVRGRDDLGGDLVERVEADADRGGLPDGGQRGRGDPARVAHQLDLGGGLELDHRAAPSLGITIPVLVSRSWCVCR